MDRESDSGLFFPARPSFGRDVLWIASAALVYFATARLSLSLIFQPEGIAAFWPPEGIFLSAILLTRRNLRPCLVGVLFITDFIAEMMAGTSLNVSAVYALALAGDAVLSSWLLLRFLGESISFRKLRDVFGFLVLAVILSNCMFSLMAAAASASIPGTSFWSSWKWWAASDGIGNLLVTPFILSWASVAKTGWGSWTPKRLLEGTALFVSLGLLNHFAFSHLHEYGQFALAVAYFSFPFLLWASLRFGMRGVTLALVVLAAVSLQSAIEGRVPGASPHGSRLDAVIIVQLYLAIMAIPSFFLAAAMNERRHAEKKIRESQRLLQMLVDGTPDVVYIKDLRGRYLLLNDGIPRITGKSAAEVIGNDDTVLFSAEEARTVMEGDREVIASGKPMTCEEQVTTAKGEKATFLSTKGPMVDERGDVTGLYGIARDITERKRAEETLRESEARYRMLFEQAGDYVLLLEQVEGGVPVIVDVNEAALAAHGYSREEVLGRPISFLEPELSHEDHVQRNERLHAADGMVLFPVRHRRKDGSTFDAEVQARIVRFGAKDYFLSVERDITERKRMEAERDRLAGAIEQAGEMVVITDADGTIQYVNPAFERTTGYSREEAVGRNPRFLKSGEQDKAFYVTLWQTISGGHRWEGRLVNKRKDGTRFTEQTTISPMCDATGKIVNYVAVKRDITEHLRLATQLLQSQKMESVGTLAGGIAHDFNNILSAIIGYGHVALMKMAQDDPQRVNIECMLEAADRAAHLTKDLLLFSRKRVGERKPVDLNKIVGKVDKFLKRVIGEDIECGTVLHGTPIPVHADSQQIEQILMNLATNARDAMPRGGTFTVRTEQVHLNASFATAHGFGKPGAYGMITVSDTGKGMDEETRKRIFEPFFTTKEVGKGTGLGLAVVYGIIARHDGFINVYSEPGIGTTFRIYLPVIASAAREEADAPPEEPAGRGTETILLAEDDKSVRDIVKIWLAEFGYTVIEAVDGEDAVRKFAENKDRIRLLLFDLIMPKMNGKEAYGEIRKITPGVKIIFASGYAPDTLRQKTSLADGTPMIYKPFSPSDLLRMVRSVLDGTK